jgi:hypothetical protein
MDNDARCRHKTSRLISGFFIAKKRKHTMKLVLGKQDFYEYPLMLKNEGGTVIGVSIKNKELFSPRSQELKILKDGLKDIAAKLDALAKDKYAEHQ